MVAAGAGIEPMPRIHSLALRLARVGLFVGRRCLCLARRLQRQHQPRHMRQKVKGNLTREEESFFDGLLTDLRMQFVSLKR